MILPSIRGTIRCEGVIIRGAIFGNLNGRM
ncbi:MAG: hypothetical protein FD169_2473 [Bacillota bacterium]|nr:MAG: hypothetical protein FD169_2473 [Bacillota bacterium]